MAMIRGGTEYQLAGEFDALIWARVFVSMVKDNPSIPSDEGTMLSWFANAIMAGYDRGRGDERRTRDLPADE